MIELKKIASSRLHLEGYKREMVRSDMMIFLLWSHLYAV